MTDLSLYLNDSDHWEASEVHELYAEGDIVRLTRSVGTMSAGVYHVAYCGSRDILYLRCLDGKSRYVNSDYARLLSYVSKTDWENNTMENTTPRIGHTIKLLASFAPTKYDNDNRVKYERLYPGCIGEITMRGDGDYFCKMDTELDSLEIYRDDFEVIDWDCESKHRIAARELASHVSDDHRHSWQYRWDETYRYCECGVSCWRLECWTGYAWRYKVPRAILNERRDLTRPQGYIEAAIPPVKTFRERSLDIIPEEALKERIYIVGAGAIGSFTALALSKMGFSSVEIMDMDMVSVENVGCQLFGHDDIGKAKVDACSDLILRFGATNVIPTFGRYSGQRFSGGIVISAVDNMATRKRIWDWQVNAANSEGADLPPKFVIDPRMGAEQAQMYVMDPCSIKDRDTMARALYDDDFARRDRCTAAATTYTAMLMAGTIAKAVKDIVTNSPKYVRIMYWNIKENSQKVFLNDREEYPGERFDRMLASAPAPQQAPVYSEDNTLNAFANLHTANSPTPTDEIAF